MNFKIINQKWSDIIGDDETGKTMAELLIAIDDLNLTENYNTWSKTVNEKVLVSAAPLAMWLLQSWWRLLYEPHQIYRDGTGHLSADWRLSHELGAANQGFVWPKIAFVSDLQHIYIVSKPTEDKNQSVRYINGTDVPKMVTLSSFEKTISSFITETIERINSLQSGPNDIGQLWEIIREELADPSQRVYRKIEALMGFDPDEADKAVMQFAMTKYEEIGHSSLEEFAASYGKYSRNSLPNIEEFFDISGLFGKPEIELANNIYRTIDGTLPWKKAVQDAHYVREFIVNKKGPVQTDKLFNVLGISSKEQHKWEEIAHKRNASVGIPHQQDGTIKFIPRKKHPLGRRFELARFIADYLTMQNGQWLVSTDLSTSRQKYQRAFAAEFLCPIGSLLEYLDNDFSKDNLIDAAENFQVSSFTVESILANNGYLENPYSAETYYSFY